MKKTWIVLLILIVIMIGVILAIIIEKNEDYTNIVENEIEEISKKITDECVDEYNELLEIEVQANSNEEKISPNCLVTLRRYYKECDHTINEYIDIPKDLINKTEEDLQKEYSTWKIEKYSSTQIVLYKEFDSNCGQHFILRRDGDKITIYKTNENNEEEIYEKTEIAFDYLTETDKIEIEKGIRVNGLEELNQLIENFE